MAISLTLMAAFLATAPPGEVSAPVTVSRNAIQPHLAAGPKGGFYAVFIRNGNIEIAVSRDGGKSFSEPAVAIDARGRARGGLQRGPRVAVDGKGVIYVTAPLCFDEAEFKKRYPRNDLYLAVSSNGGKTFSKPRRVNDAPKKAPESLHWLAASPKGDVFIAWLDIRQRSKGQDLAYAKVTSGGKKISRNAIVPGPLCECCAPGLAVDGKGNPVVAFREGGAQSNRQIFLAISRNRGASMTKTGRVNRRDSLVDG